MKERKIKIDWNYPEPKKGFAGSIDKFIGPGATESEKNMQLYIPIISALIVLSTALYFDFGWTFIQIAVATILMFDIAGGIITNASSSAKRWYHRKGQGIKEHMIFISIHLLQIAIFSLTFLNFDLLWTFLVWGLLMFCSFTILKTPIYLQRPVALILFSVCLIFSIYIFKSPNYLEWFLPLLFLKLLISHLIYEEPYRPENEDSLNL